MIIRLSDCKVFPSICAATAEEKGHGGEICFAIRHGRKFRGSYWMYMPDELEGEAWAKHPTVDVQISSHGRFMTQHNRKSTGVFYNSTGRRIARISRKGFRTNYYIDELVAETWLGAQPGDGIRHKDGDLTNNEAHNLEIYTCN